MDAASLARLREVMDGEAFLSGQTRTPKQMLQYLNDCLGMLEGEEQLPDESDNLREVAPWQQAFAEGLVAARLRKDLLDKNPRALLLVACILSHMFRIGAPLHPFQPQQLQSAMSLCLDAMEHVLQHPQESSAMETLGMKLFETMSQYKTLLLLMEPNLPLEDLLSRFFSMVFRHADSVQEASWLAPWVVTMVSDLLREDTDAAPDLLDHVLGHLNGVGKKSDPVRYALARRIIKQSGDCLQQPVGRWVLDKWNSADPQQLRPTPSTIVELNAVNTDLVLHIIPAVIADLKSERESTRFRAVKLLARLYLEEGPFADAYDAHFSQFLGAIRDSSQKIRAVMARFVVSLMHHRARWTIGMSGVLEFFVEDEFEDIRLFMVKEICHVLAQHCDSLCEMVTPSLLTKLATRMSDRKPPVRHEAMRSCASLFRHAALRLMLETGPGVFCTSSALAMMSCIPQRLFMLLQDGGVMAAESERVVEQYFFAIEDEVRALLPMEGAESTTEDGDFGSALAKAMATYFVVVHSALEAPDVDERVSKGFKFWFQRKACLRKSLAQFLHDLGEKNEGAIAQWIPRLASQFPDQAAACQEIWTFVAKDKDRNAQKFLRVLCADSLVLDETNAAFQYLSKTTKQKLPTSPDRALFSRIINRCHLGVMSDSVVAGLFLAVGGFLQTEEDAFLCPHALALAELFGTNLPWLLKDSFDALHLLLEEDDGLFRESSLKLFTAGSPYFRGQVPREMLTNLLVCVKKVVMDRASKKQVKLGIQALKSFPLERADVIRVCSSLVETFMTKLKINNKLPATLVALRKLISGTDTVDVEMDYLHQERLCSFLTDHLFASSPLNKQEAKFFRQSSPSFDMPCLLTESKEKGISLLLALVLRSPQDHSETQALLLAMLESILRSDASVENESRLDESTVSITASLVSLEPVDLLRLRCVAARAVFSLLACREVDSGLLPMDKLVYPACSTSLDTVPAPAKVAKHLYNLCVGQGYPAGKPQLQFLPYLLLFSLQNESFSQVKDWCEAVVKRFAVFRQRMPHVTLEHEAASSLFPEAHLPAIIHALAWHPLLIDEAPSFAFLQRILFTTFYLFLQTNPGSLSFMHGVLQTVRCLGDAVDLEDEGQNIACVCDIADQLLTFTARELAIGDGQESQRAREVSISIPSKILLVDKKNTHLPPRVEKRLVPVEFEILQECNPFSREGRAVVASSNRRTPRGKKVALTTGQETPTPRRKSTGSPPSSGRAKTPSNAGAVSGSGSQRKQARKRTSSEMDEDDDAEGGRSRRVLEFEMVPKEGAGDGKSRGKQGKKASEHTTKVPPEKEVETRKPPPQKRAKKGQKAAPKGKGKKGKRGKKTKSALMEVESSSEVDESVEDMDEGVGAVSEGEEDDVIFAEPPLPELTSVSMI